MERVIKPEWLDVLPPDDPEAIKSRKDLQRLNWWMRHAGRMSRLLRQAGAERWRERVVDLGAGDGRFLLEVLRRLGPPQRGATAVLVDRQQLVSAPTREAFHRLGWEVEVVGADVFDWLATASVPAGTALIANLFLHQSPDEKLKRLLQLAATRGETFAACEPRRSPLALAASRLLGFIGCNALTRHDAPISVRAGFAARELSALWPADDGWELREMNAGLFSHCFLAVRRRDMALR